MHDARTRTIGVQVIYGTTYGTYRQTEILSNNSIRRGSPQLYESVSVWQCSLSLPELFLSAVRLLRTILPPRQSILLLNSSGVSITGRESSLTLAGAQTKVRCIAIQSVAMVTKLNMKASLHFRMNSVLVEKYSKSVCLRCQCLGYVLPLLFSQPTWHDSHHECSHFRHSSTSPSLCRRGAFIFFLPPLIVWEYTFL